GNQISAQQVPRVEQILQQADINYAGVSAQDGHILVRFKRNEAQLLAAEALQRELGDQFVTAPALAPQTPQWLRAINAQPMSLGLDLRGGVHFLIQVDMDTVYENAYKRYARNVPELLRDKSIRYTRIWPGKNNLRLKFPDQQSKQAADSALRPKFSTLQFKPKPGAENTVLATLTEAEQNRLVDFSVEKNITTLRNRVNELGVSEPIVQRQGRSGIVVELPGVQNTAQAKRLLGKTATLQYRLVAQGHNAEEAEKTGGVPPGTDLFHTRDGRPILLKDDGIASGDQLVDASAGRDQKTGQPTVNVTLG